MLCDTSPSQHVLFRSPLKRGDTELQSTVQVSPRDFPDMPREWSGNAPEIRRTSVTTCQSFNRISERDNARVKHTPGTQIVLKPGKYDRHRPTSSHDCPMIVSGLELRPFLRGTSALTHRATVQSRRGQQRIRHAKKSKRQRGAPTPKPRNGPPRQHHRRPHRPILHHREENPVAILLQAD